MGSGAGHLPGRIGAQERGQRRHLLDGHEQLGGLGGEQHVALQGLLGNSAGGGRLGDLLLDERGQHVAGADGVGRDPVLGAFMRERPAQPDDLVLCGGLSTQRLVRRSSFCDDRRQTLSHTSADLLNIA